MSSVAVTCVRCGEAQPRELFDSIDARRTPRLREAVLLRELHRFQCAACRQVAIVETALTYTDFENGHWIGLFPRREMVRHEELGERVVEGFRRAMVDAAAPALRVSAETFQVRIVFGYEQLREKLVCWDAGLDDRLLEALKLELILDRPTLLEMGLAGLTLEAVNGDWLLFDAFNERFEPVRGFKGGLVPRAVYRELAEEIVLPDVKPGPFINLLKNFDVLSPAADRSSVGQRDK